MVRLSADWFAFHGAPLNATDHWVGLVEGVTPVAPGKPVVFLSVGLPF